MTTRRLTALVSALALALAAPVAAKDVTHAQAMADAGNFAGARAELASPKLRADPDALMLAARLNRDGAGAPADPVAAYRDFTLVFMLGEPDLRAEAAGERRQVGRGLSLAQIRAAEGQVIDWLDAGIGAEARQDAVHDLISTLQDCIAALDTCDDAVWMTFALGPAAAPAAPYLERMMTADPMWMSRIDYVQALVAIGTAAVPELCNIMRDGQQFALEGPWNAESAAEGLALLGPAGREALPCLAEALTATYGPIPDETTELGDMFGTPEDEMMLSMRVNMAQAIINTGDPERAIHDSLVDADRRTDDLTLRILLSWIMGMTYGEPMPAITLAEVVLADDGSGKEPGEMAQWMMLSVLFDLTLRPGVSEQAQGLLPQLRKMETDGPEDLREIVHSLIEAITAPG